MRSPAPVGVDAGDVADVVAVALHEAHHRVLVGEEEVAAADAAPGAHRAVVGELVGATVGAAVVEVRPAVGVVGDPGRVGGLEDDVGGAGVVAHDEGDVAGVAVAALQVGDVDAGHRSGGHVPRRGDAPVAAVDGLGRDVVDAAGLVLREGGARGDRGDLARAVALVVADPVDVDRVGRGVGLDLEVDTLADVDRDVGGEALDRIRPGSPMSSQTPGSVPGLEFSQTILLPPGAQGSAALAGPSDPSTAGTDQDVECTDQREDHRLGGPSSRRVRLHPGHVPTPLAGRHPPPPRIVFPPEGAAAGRAADIPTFRCSDRSRLRGPAAAGCAHC